MTRWVDCFRLSRREYFADFFITPPVTAALIALSLWRGASWLWPLAFAVGVLAWTLYEYALHRWVLHLAWLARDLHALHHDDQRDYIATHPLATIALYVALWLAFGFQASAFAAGFSAGYVFYAFAHTAFHYATIGTGHPLFALKRHHALHHSFENCNFGVSTTLWDRAFRTIRR
jgi:sterol desaturase/sphingolipid hydroxylase (fatty acid hydroxylase superfamily)